MKPPKLRERSSGVLLHLSSLPGPHGNGDLGEEARRFASWLARAGQRWWQMLPVGPAGYGDSPYSSLSAFAGNPLFVDLDVLGVPLEAPGPELTGARDAVDYAAATAYRERHLRAAAAELDEDPAPRARFDAFCDRERAWLDDFALFDALKRAHGGRAWVAWDAAVRGREPSALAAARHDLAADVRFAQVVQWMFDEQWEALRAHCRAVGVGLVGDVPIFVAHDSADVWQHPELFDLDPDGQPRHIAGVPPDYFSATGQRWGNPLYRWKRIAATGYAWWVARFRSALRRFDVLRLDHFIGFTRYWQIPADEPTAIRGRWMKGPGKALFDAVARALGHRGEPLPLIAEDLGLVTPRVKRLRRELGIPGIRLVQFAFGTDPQAPSFLPHNYPKSAVVYTGTHDNDTTVGWFEDRGGSATSTRTEADAARERRRVLAYLGMDGVRESDVDIAAELLRLAQASVARTAIAPLQDVLGLGSDARMNRPGTAKGNWRWRMRAEVDEDTAARLRALAETYGRIGGPGP